MLQMLGVSRLFKRTVADTYADAGPDSHAHAHAHAYTDYNAGYR